jgi:hypothetical protein
MPPKEGQSHFYCRGCKKYIPAEKNVFCEGCAVDKDKFIDRELAVLTEGLAILTERVEMMTRAFQSFVEAGIASKRPAEPLSEWLKPKEAAAYLRVSSRTIHRLHVSRVANKFPSYVREGMVRIRRSHLDSWIMEGKIASQQGNRRSKPNIDELPPAF